MKRLLVLAALVLSASSLALVPAGATTLGPAASAWYDATYPTTTPAPPAPPPGVSAGQLLVSGATISTSLLPAQPPAGPITTTRTTALAALRFTIPAGATPSTFTLLLAPGLSTAALGGRLPVTPLACPTTSTFLAGGHQAFDKAPTYDCSGRTSLGQLTADKTAVVFSDIASVARGKQLSFVVLPGTLGVDRLVFQPPTSKALQLLSFDTPPTFNPGGTLTAPPVTSPLVPPVVAAPPVTNPVVVVPVAPAVTSAPLPAASLPPLPSAAPALSAPDPVQQAAGKPVSDHPVRVKVLGGLVLLVASGLFFALTDRRREEGVEWGVGRHRAVRDGRAPAL